MYKRKAGEGACKKRQIFMSPVCGRVIKLEEVPDAVIAKGLLGRGAAVLPENGRVVSPVDGTVTLLCDTGHAIGITSKDGAEILIHIGIDTVCLRGRGFKTYVNQGDRVKRGQHLLDFDPEGIKREGYETVTAILITNPDIYMDIVMEQKERVGTGQILLKAYKKP